VSIETSMLVDWPATITKPFGSAEAQPMNVQLDRLREYEPGTREASSDPDTSHPLEVHAIGRSVA
jgi:hypothetical protein